MVSRYTELNDDSLYFTKGIYNFKLIITAEGGEYSQNMQLNVIYDCIYDSLDLYDQLPLSISSNYTDGEVFLQNGRPVVIFEGLTGSFSSISLEIGQLMTNNASTYCPIERYEIDQVIDNVTNYLYHSSEYESKMDLDEGNGVW